MKKNKPVPSAISAMVAELLETKRGRGLAMDDLMDALHRFLAESAPGYKPVHYVLKVEAYDAESFAEYKRELRARRNAK